MELKNTLDQLLKNNFAVKAVYSPTVPEGQEGLRICLHSYNDVRDIEKLFQYINSQTL